MNLRLDLHVLGWLLVLLGTFQLLPVGAAAIFGEPSAPYLLSALASILSGFLLGLATRTGNLRLRPRDGFFIVGFAWLVASLFGAVPFLLSGALGPVDAFFEAVAGFTTTGSTVMSGIDDAPRPLLLWRSLTQWLGGMGIILFTIAILPLLGIGGMQLFKAEVPGPIADKVRPRVAETARRLWLIYLGFTAAEWIALSAAGVGGFEALCHSLTTLATGGFSTRDLSIGGFHSSAVEWIVTAFMLIAGINFVLHYRLFTGRRREVWRDPELHYFLFVVVGAVSILTVSLMNSGEGVSDAVRLASFQAVSVVTTTGYTTADFEVWPSVTQLVLLLLMVLGGMSGSTGGGVKSLRALIGLRALAASVNRLLHPRAVLPVKYAGRPVSEEILGGIWTFFTAYFLIAALAAGVIAAYGYDLVTSFSAALTAIGNVGPGLGAIGPYDNFAHLPTVVKLVLSFCMIAGRLELFTILVLLSPRFWRH